MGNVDVIGAFIESEGLVPLALEKINRPICANYPGNCQHEPRHEGLVDAHELTKQLAARLPELQDLTRAKVLMAAYAASQMAIAMACSNLGKMEPFETSKTATNFLDKLAELTKKPNSGDTYNLNQLVWNQLPDEDARQAWLYITQKQKPQVTAPVNPEYDWQLPTVIEHGD